VPEQVTGDRALWKFKKKLFETKNLNTLKFMQSAGTWKIQVWLCLVVPTHNTADLQPTV